jgi:ATP-dependent helicase/nuclease subunit B
LLELAPHLEAALNAGQTVVVPTTQRAAALRLSVATHQLERGRRAFRTPDVHSLSGWLRGQPARAGATGGLLRRLGESEEWLLWRSAVTEAAERLSLPATGLTDAVRQSATLLFEWRLPPAALRQAGTPEALLLSHCLEAMDARLADLGASASWRALEDLALQPPRRAPLFTGFSYRTPARQALLAAWALRGTTVEEPRCSFPLAPSSLHHAVDPAAELEQVAQWCRERLTAAPAARLLVIIPELGQRQSEVRGVFDAALEAGSYAVEGGQPLLRYAPVAEGLLTLQLLSSEAELAQISQWLRAAFWAQPEPSARAMLDVWLRSVVPPRFGVVQLLHALRAAPSALLRMADEIATFLERLRAAFDGSRASMGTWSARFAQVLALCDLHAAAARQRGSHAQQVLQRLDELLRECAALPSVLGACHSREAVSVFAQLLARTRFEPATGDAPVTLSASLADPVVRYDGIWVSGLHAGAIPERARLDPFIPVSLQRQAHVISADAAALVDQAERALQTLCRSSREFHVSAPAHAEDLELAASPLLAPYAHTIQAAAPRSSAGHARIIRAARVLETFADEQGAAWPQGLPLPAGTRAIELQSRCPFRAYAQLRLGAEPLQEPVPGITPRERGTLLHRALELLWQRLGGSVGLATARATQGQVGLIRDCVAQAARELLRRAEAGEPEDPALSAAADATGLLELRRAAIGRELDRAARLINALCEVEATRAPFVIYELEAAHRLSIAGALLDVRIDRVDRLEDGTHAILDYKSGRAVTPDWEVERTTHPQLLVYLLAAGVPVSALGVAHLDPKSVVFKGIGDADQRLPGVRGSAEPWALQVAAWDAQVRRLAGDFVRGEARVDPMDKACDHCHLHAFCRIAELQ